MAKSKKKSIKSKQRKKRARKEKALSSPPKQFSPVRGVSPPSIQPAVKEQ